MSDYSRKTSFEPPPRDRRRVDQDPARVPPHKKPRKYRLTVKYEIVTTETCTKDFTSKAAMQEFRTRVEREIAKVKAQKTRKSYRYWGSWYRTDLKMESEELKEFRAEPQFSEEMID